MAPRMKKGGLNDERMNPWRLSFEGLLSAALMINPVSGLGAAFAPSPFANC